MFWNKKPNESGLPELPPPKPLTLPKTAVREMDVEGEEYNNESTEKHSLPSFPDSPTKRGFSQTAIKNAVDTSEESEENEESIPSPLSMQRATMEMPETKRIPSLPKPVSIESLSEMSEMQDIPERLSYSEPSHTISSERTKDVFVKIDKFQSARKSLASASEKVDEIESLLKKIRDTRLREDQELSAWEKDLELVKTKIEEISKNIFEKA